MSSSDLPFLGREFVFSWRGEEGVFEIGRVELVEWGRGGGDGLIIGGGSFRGGAAAEEGS